MVKIGPVSKTPTPPCPEWHCKRFRRRITSTICWYLWFWWYMWVLLYLWFVLFGDFSGFFRFYFAIHMSLSPDFGIPSLTLSTQPSLSICGRIITTMIILCMRAVSGLISQSSPSYRSIRHRSGAAEWREGDSVWQRGSACAKVLIQRSCHWYAPCDQLCHSAKPTPSKWFERSIEGGHLWESVIVL